MTGDESGGANQHCRFCNQPLGFSIPRQSAASYALAVRCEPPDIAAARIIDRRRAAAGRLSVDDLASGIVVRRRAAAVGRRAADALPGAVVILARLRRGFGRYRECQQCQQGLGQRAHSGDPSRARVDDKPARGLDIVTQNHHIIGSSGRTKIPSRYTEREAWVFTDSAGWYRINATSHGYAVRRISKLLFDQFFPDVPPLPEGVPSGVQRGPQRLRQAARQAVAR